MAAGATFAAEPVAEGLVIPMGKLIELVQKNVLTETWSNSRNKIWGSNDQLMIVQKPEVLQSIQTYVAALAKDRGRVIAVDSRVLELSGKRVGAGLWATPFEPGTPVTPDALKTLFSEAANGPDVRRTTPFAGRGPTLRGDPHKA